MKRLLSYLLLFFTASVFLSCSKSDDDPEVTYDSPLKNLSQIITVTEGIGNWDAAYITPEGYFCYSDNATKMISSTRAGETTIDDNALLCFMSDGMERETVSLLLQHDTHLPIQVIFKDAQADFCYLNDSILEVIYTANDKVNLVNTIAYNKKAIMAAASKYDNNLQRSLYYYCQLLKDIDLSAYPAANALLQKFKATTSYLYDPNVTKVTVDIEKAITGEWNFTIDAKHYVADVVSKEYFSIMLWTGNASFKVGGSSCTLGGAVYCASPTFRDLGTYGVVISTSKDKLTLEQAEYTKQAEQKPTELSYEVDFRGFKAKTTYYYRSYYKFNTADHGSLNFKYGDKNAEVAYDTEIKNFTTGENKLFVDVVMCIDVTGSMNSIIQTVKNNAMQFYDVFSERSAKREIEITGMNIQVYAYQDINVDGDLAMINSETFAMPDQNTEFKNYVSELHAMGGGDTPESGLEVLNNAFSKEDFSIDDGYHRQVVILWTDAPYLIGEAYTSLTASMVEEKWNTLPSGRRLVLFAPSGDGYCSNGGDWDVMDSWTNCIHYTNLYDSFNNMVVSIDAIIDELTSGDKAKYVRQNKARTKVKVVNTPN